jgi:hypothetical protein
MTAELPPHSTYPKQGTPEHATQHDGSHSKGRCYKLLSDQVIQICKFYQSFEASPSARTCRRR